MQKYATPASASAPWVSGTSPAPADRQRVRRRAGRDGRRSPDRRQARQACWPGRPRAGPRGCGCAPTARHPSVPIAHRRGGSRSSAGRAPARAGRRAPAAAPAFQPEMTPPGRPRCGRGLVTGPLMRVAAIALAAAGAAAASVAASAQRAGRVTARPVAPASAPSGGRRRSRSCERLGSSGRARAP